MKRRTFFRALFPCFALIFSCASLSSCKIINTQFGLEEEEGDVDNEDIDGIMAKYDGLFAENPYAGEACTINLVHWDGDGQSIEMSVLNTMLKGFNKRYPTINVNLTILSSYEQAYSIRLNGNDVADVFLMPDGNVMSWARIGGGKCEDLGPYIEESNLVDLDEMYPTAVSRYRYDFNKGRCGGTTGTMIALPKDIGPTVMYYNKAAFRAANLPYPSNTEIMDVDDAFSMWRSLIQKNASGNVTMYGVGGLSTEGLVWSCGGDFLNPERTKFPTDPATKAGLKKGYEYMQQSYVDVSWTEDDCVQPPASWTTGSDAAKLFSNQMLACYVGLKSKVAAFRKLDFDWDVCPVPAGSVNPTKNAWSGSVGYSMYNGSKHKDAAWKLIEYIASKEGQELLSATGFQIPVYPSLAEQEDYIERESSNKPANFQCFLKAAEEQPIGLWSYHSSQLWKTEAYDKDVEKVYAEDEGERISVDEFLETTERNVNLKLKQ
ncbi:MAG: extracellular solute-binding protein [Bacilli bacterium]|nr:extracellular solute-binding protein [Bacilli bacterium]